MRYLRSRVLLSTLSTTIKKTTIQHYLALAIITLTLASCGGANKTAEKDDPAAVPNESQSPRSGLDVEPPSKPSGLTAVAVSGDAISVSWTASADNTRVAGYAISADGIALGTVTGTAVTVDNLDPNTRYTITAQAVDAAGNRSAVSSALDVTTKSADDTISIQHSGAPRLGFPGNGGGNTPPTPDVTAPSVPSGIVASAIGPTQATLSWIASTDDVGVATYEIYDGPQLVSLSSQAVVTILGLTPSTSYAFAIQAKDAAQNTSALSAPVTITTLAAAPSDPTTPNAAGQEIYAQTCAVCHGVDGQGTGQGTAAPIVGVTRALPLTELTTLIETTMPTTDPTSCVGTCAADVAQYVFDTFTSQPTDGIIPEAEPLAGLLTGQEQVSALCTRLALLGRNDVVHDVFCGTAPAQIADLRGLQNALGLTFNNPSATGRGNNAANGNPGFALTGHSTSLVARFVNAINPRAIIFTPANRNGPSPNGFVAMGFVRGDQFVEIAAADRTTNVINFYLVSFKQACNVNDSCTTGQLLTPAIESNWVDVTVYDDADLSNTVLDCLQCHQPNGPGTTKLLRMQELADPWTHWFRDNRPSSLLIRDFQAAHGTNEAYAGIPANLIAASDPEELEDLVRSTGVPQPNRFNSGRIQAEVNQTPGQPADNTIPGTSATWNEIYQRSVLAQAIAVPYHDIKVTDPAVLPGLIQSYRSFVDGTLSADALPDIRDAFYTAQLRDIGFKVQAGLDGAGIVLQACGQCHNSRLDQTIGRARFNVDLDAMSDTRGARLTGDARDAEIGLAITRLLMPIEDARKMPPEMFRSLEAAEIDLAIAYLCAQTTTTLPQCVGR